MEIEIAVDRKLIAQHALVIYGYEKDPRCEEPANSIDHYITKHRIDRERQAPRGSAAHQRSTPQNLFPCHPLSSNHGVHSRQSACLCSRHGDSLVDPECHEARFLYERNGFEIGCLPAAGDAVPCRQSGSPHVGPRHRSEARAQHSHLPQPFLQCLRRRDVLHGEHQSSPERIAGRH